jgi:hypothetical protein
MPKSGDEHVRYGGGAYAATLGIQSFTEPLPE